MKLVNRGFHGIVADVDYSNDFILVHDVQGTFVVGNGIQSTELLTQHTMVVFHQLELITSIE